VAHDRRQSGSPVVPATVRGACHRPGGRAPGQRQGAGAQSDRAGRDGFGNWASAHGPPGMGMDQHPRSCQQAPGALIPFVHYVPRSALRGGAEGGEPEGNHINPPPVSGGGCPPGGWGWGLSARTHTPWTPKSKRFHFAPLYGSVRFAPYGTDLRQGHDHFWTIPGMSARPGGSGGGNELAGAHVRGLTTCAHLSDPRVSSCRSSNIRRSSCSSRW
jgi:hypothetical protein